MGLKEPVEILYLALMQRWERDAPPDGRQGLLDGVPERNTQKSRMVYLLQKIAVPHEDLVYQTLARYTRRNDGESYFSRDSSWMKEPCALGKGWYFEGCTSLHQKQDCLKQLTRVGLSPSFVRAADDFVAGLSIESYFPTDEEGNEILERIKAREAHEDEDA